MAPQIDPLQKLENLFAVQREVSAEQAQAPERLRPTYEVALAAAQSALSEMLQDSAVQEAVQGQEASYQSDISTIDSLLTRGLLTNDQAEAEVARIIRHPDYRLLRLVRHLGKSLIPEEPASPAIVPSPLPTKSAAAQKTTPTTAISSPQAKPTAKDLQLTNKGTTRQGRMDSETSEKVRDTIEVVIYSDSLVVDGVPYPDTIHGRTKDRKVTILKAVSLLIPGDTVSVKDLWDLAYPGEEFRRKDFTEIREWLTGRLSTQNTYEPLLIHNGKRGLESSYTYNEATELKLVDKSDQVLPDQSPKTSRQTQPALSIQESSTKTVRPFSASSNHGHSEQIEEVEDYTTAPNLESMQLIRLVIQEAVEQSGDTFDTNKFAAELLDTPDLSTLSPKAVSDVTALTLLRINKLLACKGDKLESFRDIQRDNTRLIAFLESILPITREYQPILTEKKEMRRIAAQVISKLSTH